MSRGGVAFGNRAPGPKSDLRREEGVARQRESDGVVQPRDEVGVKGFRDEVVFANRAGGGQAADEAPHQEVVARQRESVGAAQPRDEVGRHKLSMQTPQPEVRKPAPRIAAVPVGNRKLSTE